MEANFNNLNEPELWEIRLAVRSRKDNCHSLLLGEILKEKESLLIKLKDIDAKWYEQVVENTSKSYINSWNSLYKIFKEKPERDSLVLHNAILKHFKILKSEFIFS